MYLPIDCGPNASIISSASSVGVTVWVSERVHYIGTTVRVPWVSSTIDVATLCGILEIAYFVCRLAVIYLDMILRLRCRRLAWK